VMLAAAGARLRTARFAADPGGRERGVCVLLNGQTEFIEKYFEVIDELRHRNFAVVTLDWRGQGGSGRMVPDAPLKAHVRDFAEYDADLDALMAQVVEPMLAGRRAIALAHSMGGHNLLRYLHAHPGCFAAAAFSAPLLMFSTRGVPRWVLRLVTAAMMASGRTTDFVWGMGRRDPLTLTFDRQIVTSDRNRFQRTKDFLKSHPDLRLTGPTWGWVAACLRSMAQFAARDYAEQIATPSLICGAGHDRICITEDTRHFAARIPDVVYIEIADCQHEILMERDVFRAQFWKSFDQFLDQHL
jgi:lysophospholipase